MGMSITPRKPPDSVETGATGSTAASPGWLRRAREGLRDAVGAARRRLGTLVQRCAATVTGRGPSDGSNAEPAGGTGLRPGPVARIGDGGAKAGVDGRRRESGLPGTTPPAGPELPPRPDLEVERTEAGLELRQSGKEEAFLASDEWIDVKR
jgi:hypothetical protein